MNVRDAMPSDALFVIQHLDIEGHIEQTARSFTGDVREPATKIAAAIGAPTMLRCDALCHDDGAPFGLFGAWVQSPGVATLYGCGTADLHRHSRAFWRYAIGRFIPHVLVPSVRVARMSALAGRGRWITLLQRVGFRTIGDPLPLGAAGEMFQELAWLNPRMVDGVLPGLASTTFGNEAARHV